MLAGSPGMSHAIVNDGGATCLLAELLELSRPGKDAAKALTLTSLWGACGEPGSSSPFRSTPPANFLQGISRGYKAPARRAQGLLGF
jgi:hypothetical protein